MDTWALLIVTLGIGGAVGAAAATWVAFRRVGDAAASVAESFQQAVARHPILGSSPLGMAVDDLKVAVEGLGGAFEKLRRALKWR
ncbi:MAG: hypothetical protein HONBIEJF_02101 [Fimbriimonadaceae bacterium]|nr:hypothetical protein [Fimbriimonadaceae bacterium]